MMNTKLANLERVARADWTKWTGGDCPVALSALVEVQYRHGRGGSGEYLLESGLPAGDYDWAHSRERFSDIIAYRVVA